MSDIEAEGNREGNPLSVATPLPKGTVMEKMRILIVSANPRTTTSLDLDEEVREIESKVRGAELRDSIEIITKWASRPDDLLQSLNQYKPHIVHFSGHGSDEEEIILLDQVGNSKPVGKTALVSLFHTLKDNIRVVVLNACFSKSQAMAITKNIDFTIGMNNAIGDRAAITFAASFYRAIGFGRSVKNAYEQGLTAILLDGSPEDNTPKLFSRKGVSPESVHLIEFNSRETVNTTKLADLRKKPQAASPGPENSGVSPIAKNALDRVSAHDLIAAIEPERIKPLDDALLICALRDIPGNSDNADYILEFVKSALKNNSLIKRKKTRKLIQRANKPHYEFEFDDVENEKWQRGYDLVRYIMKPIIEEIPSHYDCYKKIASAGKEVLAPFLVDRYFSNPWGSGRDHDAFTQRRLIRSNVTNIIGYSSLEKECFFVLESEIRHYLDDRHSFDLESHLEHIDLIKVALGSEFSGWYESFAGVPYEADLQALNERRQADQDKKEEELKVAREEYYSYQDRYRGPPTARQAELLRQKLGDLCKELEETKKSRWFGESNRLIDRAKQLLKPFFPDVAFRIHKVQEDFSGPYAREKVLEDLRTVSEFLEIKATEG